MMSNVLRRRSMLISGVAATVVLLAAWSVAGGADEDNKVLARRLDSLEGRICDLERTVGETLLRSTDQPALAQRISTLELGVRELSRAAGRPGQLTPRGNLRELERSTRDRQQQGAALEGRLYNLERDLRAALGDMRETRELRTQLDQQRHAIDDLKGRVRRLESR
ncbi:MAG: hypothetical protein KKB50_20415 [Planctomycetes bacterium]|nr:hypothetical protein [Planctomycetota bacterium]